MCLAPPTLESGQDRGGSLQGHTTLFQANCVAVADLGPSLAYQYKAPAAGWLTLELVSQGDLALSAHKGSCQNTGYSYCKNVVGAGGTETLVVEVAQGESWFAVVTAAKKNQPKSFVIRATFEAQVCGDGKVSPGEQCDDGNTLDGDGCSADCKNDSCDNAPALEDKLVTGKGQTPSPTVTNGEFTAGVSLLQASCSKLGVTTPERIHSFRAANPGRLEVSVVPKNPGDDLILSVRSSCAPQGELSCADAAQAGGAERLSLPAEAGQPFYFVVEGADPSAQGGYELRAQTLPVSCGDGLLVRSVEQCDPNAEEKNCADGCTRLPDDGDSSGSAAVAKFPASGSALGRIFPEGDADTFSIEVGPGEKMRLTVTDPTAAPDCADRRLDSQIEVFDAEGLLVAFNDDPSPGASAKGYCSEVLLPSAGTYTVRVRASQRSAPAQVFSYRLLATPL
jgi:cysteine-rich repeat protein